MEGIAPPQISPSHIAQIESAIRSDEGNNNESEEIGSFLTEPQLRGSLSGKDLAGNNSEGRQES
jgi:hypothetical protein